MEVFQKLAIFVNLEQVAFFRDEVIVQANRINWINKTEFERDYRMNVMDDDIVICLQSPKYLFKQTELQAFVWMRHNKEVFELFNIIPSLTRKLSYEQYNFILDQFYKCIIKEVALKMNLDTITTSPYKSMQEIIGDEAFDTLIRFSRSANKASGNSNHYDFDRWCDFVFTIFRNNIKINMNDFSRWLEEDENWPNDIANKLSSDLEYSLSILEKYELTK
jgi:hypothetical protein